MKNRPIRKALIVRSAFGDIYEPAWVRALNELGVEARLFDAHKRLGNGLGARIQERLLAGPGIAALNRGVLEELRLFRPDVALFYAGHHFHRATIEAARSEAFVVGYHCDDPFGPRHGMLRYRHLLSAVSAYQGYHVHRECNVAEGLACGVPRCKLLMDYFLPWLHYPRQLSAEDKLGFDCDVVFAGHPEPDLRMACLVGAARAGHKVRVFGYVPYWRRWMGAEGRKRILLRPGLSSDDYPKALCGSRIAACFFSRWNRDQYTTRVFEIPACGGFLLAERTPVMLQLYREGKEAEFFGSTEEFADKVAFYLKNDRARARIAQAGHLRAHRSGYDVHSRMRQWLKDVTGWMSDV